jgi:hypothetical protein
MWRLPTLLVVPILIGVVAGREYGADISETATLVVLPILVGAIVGQLIPDVGRAIVLVASLAFAGLLILVNSPIDDDIPRWTAQAFVVWMAAVGVLVGLSVRVIAARLEHRGSS